MTNEEAIEKVKDMRDFIIREHSPNDVFISHMNEAIEALEEQRPHGEWIYKDKKGQFCSVCDKQSVWKFDFCPNCGASMQANDRQVTGKLNSEIEKSKSEIVPDYRDGWRKRGEQ